MPLATLLTRTPTLSPPEWQSLNWFYRWLLMVRAVVLVMTLSSVVVGVVLAADVTALSWDRVFALLLGLTLAHASNNLINDWTDQRMGIDQENYFRRRYGTHVLEDALISHRAFWLTTIATGSLALACGIYLTVVIGIEVLYLTLAGALFVLFYTWPLKHYALGELAVLLVWGPLLTAGSYFVLTETINAKVLLVSLLAGIGPTLVILGKHMDKFDYDLARSIRTLPVAIGIPASRILIAALLITQWLLLAYLILAHGMFALLVCCLAAASIKPLASSLMTPRPIDRPTEYPEDVWPLWYSAFGFKYCRDFGFALLAGLLLQLAA